MCCNSPRTTLTQGFRFSPSVPRRSSGWHCTRGDGRKRRARAEFPAFPRGARLRLGQRRMRGEAPCSETWGLCWGCARALAEPFSAASQPAATWSFAKENDFGLPLQPRLQDVQKRLFYLALRTAGGWLLMDIWR